MLGIFRIWLGPQQGSTVSGYAIKTKKKVFNPLTTQAHLSLLQICLIKAKMADQLSVVIRLVVSCHRLALNEYYLISFGLIHAARGLSEKQTVSHTSRRYRLIIYTKRWLENYSSKSKWIRVRVNRQLQICRQCSDGTPSPAICQSRFAWHHVFIYHVFLMGIYGTEFTPSPLQCLSLPWSPWTCLWLWSFFSPSFSAYWIYRGELSKS